MTSRDSRTIRARGPLVPLVERPGVRILALRAEAGPLDPFLSVDEFHMAAPTFPPHPHAGFSAVTVMLEDSAGRFINRDSLGDRSPIGPGDIHWTQAGRGMMHEEIPEATGRDCHGLQVFVNLPAELELADPAAFHADASEIPAVEPAPGARVRVLCGEAFGASSPLDRLLFAPLMLDVQLAPGARLEVPVPPDHNAFVIALGGRGHVAPDAEPLNAGEAAGLAPGAATIALQAADDAPLHVFLGAGPPIGEPVVLAGPFALSSEERALDARRRYSSGGMGSLAPSAAT